MQAITLSVGIYLVPLMYLSRDGEQFGPFPPEQIQKMLETGQVLPTDLYWQEGMQEWSVVSERWIKTPQPGTPPLAPKTHAPAVPANSKRGQNKRPLAIYSILAAIAIAASVIGYFWINKPEAAKAAESPSLQATASNSQSFQPSPAPKLEAAPEGYLRVVSWNLEWYPGGSMDATPEQSAKHEQVAKADLLKITPDIFLAQEIRSWPDFERLVSTLPGLNTAVVSSFKLGREVGKQQAAIASRLPVNSAWYEEWKSSSPTPPRGFSAAVLEVPNSNKLLLVYSIHLKSNRAMRDGDAEKNNRMREESARQLIVHVRDMENLFEGRISGIIVGGDFNTNHDGQFGDSTISIMVDAGFHCTWDGVPAEARQSWRGGGRYKPTTLDYIFTKGISPLRARILQAEVSDHHPIEISVPLSELSD